MPNAVCRTVRPMMVALLVASAASPAVAQPACSAANAGARLCMVDQACTCAHDRGGQLTGVPPGWRWSCSLLEACDAPPPATLEESPNSYPIILDQPRVEYPANSPSRTGYR